MTQEPHKAFRELMETRTEISRLEQLRIHRAHLVRELYEAGVTTPVLAKAADLSESAVKAIIGEVGGPSEDRRQKRELAKELAETFPDIGKRLQVLRTSKRLSRRTVAEKLGVPVLAYETWEQDGLVPGDVTHKLAELYNISAGEILFGHPAERTREHTRGRSTS
jgi:DNA-binding transcriptional regulator YiaG